MAIGTFAQLKTAAANWLDRSDLTDRIPEFIALAEARFNRELRTRDMETVSTAISTVAGTREYSLPTGFVQMKEFHLSTDPLTPLAYITPEMMTIRLSNHKRHADKQSRCLFVRNIAGSGTFHYERPEDSGMAGCI